MATYDIYSVASSGRDWLDTVQWDVLARSSATIILENSDGSVLYVSGSGFNTTGQLSSGTITAIRHYNNQAAGILHAELTGLSFSGATFAQNIGNLGHRLFEGDDTITAHVANVALNGYGGTNTIYYYLNNVIHAAGGNDTITYASALTAAGSQNDWISYEFRPDGTLNTIGYRVDLDINNSSGAIFADPGEGRDLVPGFPGIFGSELDDLTGIDHIRGSHGNDILLGHQTGGGGGLPTTFSEIHGLGGDDSIQRAQIAYGGDGNDTIMTYGLEGYSLTQLWEGFYYGENGNDTFRFVVSPNVAWTIRYLDGGDGTDAIEANGSHMSLIDSEIFFGANSIGLMFFTSIENVIGGSGDNYITASAVENEVWGLAGADRIEGLGGEDTLHGGANNDTIWGDFDPNGMWNLFPFPDAGDVLFGDAGDDHLFGQSGNDTLEGGTGADMLEGGAGTADWAAYTASTTGVTVSLVTGVLGIGGDAAGDSLVGIENLLGSGHADQLFGDGGANHLRGANGDDQMFGGNGSDMLYGGLGADTHDGGAGTDYARYNDAAYGDLVISLIAPATNTGAAAGDTYIAIEGIIAGTGNDDITGNGSANFLYGMQGNDVLRGEAGADKLYGGTNNDQLFGGVGNDSLFGDAGDDTLDGGANKDTMTGGVGSDTFVFASASNAGLNATRDVITDFDVTADFIDLSAIDAATGSSLTLGMQSFTTLFGPDAGGNATAFSAQQQLRYYFLGQGTATTSDDVTIIEGNTSGIGNSAPEFQIELKGFHTLTFDEFILA